MVQSTPTQVLLATTLQPLVAQLSGSLAHGARLIDQFLAQEPTPQKMALCEQELRALLREVGRRLLTWMLHRMEPERPEARPSRLWFEGRASRRRRKHRPTIATRCGPVVVGDASTHR